MRCSVTFGNISFQGPASFFLALSLMFMTHKRSEIWMQQGGALVLSLVQEMHTGFSFVKSCSGVHNT